MALPPQPPASPAPPDNGTSYATFSGLKNTVSPESLTARELARAQNVDLDDLGQIHRRRGRRLAASGYWHSLFTTTAAPHRTFGVQDGTLVSVNPDFTTRPLLEGIADAPLAWVQVGPTVYFCSPHNSGQIDVASLIVSPWGRVTSPSYQPGLEPGPEDWWFSPVAEPELDLGLGAVGGRLLGAPPLGSYLEAFNGRIYIGAGSVLWATELYLYNYVDKNKGYRYFESKITGICAVDDGVYVGTEEALYFLTGIFGEHVRTMKAASGVVPGSMVAAPGELIDPEGRRFPDLPRQTSLGMVCMTRDGVVAGLPSGNTFNLTQTQYRFPRAVEATAMVRQEDGMTTAVVVQKSGGQPTDSARFGDYLSAELIRAGTPGQPGGAPDVPRGAYEDPAVESET